MYILERFDPVHGWTYINSFFTYANAVEKLENMKRRFNGDFRIEYK